MTLTSSATFLILIRRTWLSLRRSAVTFSALVSFYVDVKFEPLLTIVDTGQVYYTLLQEREEKGINDVAISRVEQLSPFPYDLVCIGFVNSYGIDADSLHRSPLISTSTPTRTSSGVRRSRSTTARGRTSALAL